MTEKSLGFSVLSTYTEIAPFIQEVIKNADTEKNALGFFPSSVFYEYARKEQLYVAVDTSQEKNLYAGHLLYDCRPPRAKVLQVFCSPIYRRNGIAAILINRLKRDLSDNGFISIYARVAEDLNDSNHFWESQCFYVKSVVPGGRVKKRIILERVHELESPQLFSASGISHENPLGIEVYESVQKPIFLLDLNVLFDLGPRRSRNQSAIDLFRSERLGSCRLAVSTELEKELLRTSSDKKTDPMIAFARIFHSFSYSDGEDADRLVEALLKLVFKDRHHLNNLTKNDISDVKHLATAIQHKLSGLITNDNAILNAAVELKREYGIVVISPDSFRQTNAAYQEEAFSFGDNTELQLIRFQQSQRDAVVSLLSRIDVPVADIYSEWLLDGSAKASTCFAVLCHSDLVAYIVTFKDQPRKNIFGRIVIDEDSAMARNAAQIAIRTIQDMVLAGGATKIVVSIPAKQSIVREMIAEEGFISSGIGLFTKITLASVVTEANWSSMAELLRSQESIHLPSKCPAYRGHHQHIEIKTPSNSKIHISLEKLETLLSPILFFVPGREAVVVPVQKRFSEGLIGASRQLSLLAQQQASAYQDRLYLSGPNTHKLLKPGAIIFFYESKKGKGLGSIIAIAKVKNSYLRSVELIKEIDLEPSVLSHSQLEEIGMSKVKTVTKFGNLHVFKNPVDLKILKSIGCGGPNDLITAKKITNQQAGYIISEGFRDA